MVRISLRWILAAGLLSATSVPVSAQVIVYDSGGEASREFQRGRELPGGAPIILPDRSYVTIIHGAFMRTFVGPGTFAARMSDSDASLERVPPMENTVRILRIFGPSVRTYRTWQTFDAETVFRLRPGDTLLLYRAGEARLLSGPGQCTWASQSCPQPNQANVQAGTAAIRGPGLDNSPLSQPRQAYIVCPSNPRCPRN